MLLRSILVFFFACSLSPSFANDLTDKFDTEAFYLAFSKEDIDLVNEQLKLIDPEKSVTFKAYVGALLMKKSGLLKRPKDKLEAFKSGRDLLEDAIKRDSENAEFRFLRLVIQEQAPGILKYNDKKKEDAQMVEDSFDDFPKIVQQFIRDYAKNSEALASQKL